MSAFYTFYLSKSNDYDFEDIKNNAIEFTPKLPENFANGQEQIRENSEERLRIFCEYFSLSLSRSGPSLEYKSECYGMKFQYEFYLNLYVSSENWISETLRFIGKSMLKFNANCVLEANGEQPLIIRKDNKVVLDNTRLNGYQKQVFNELCIEYSDEILETM